MKKVYTRRDSITAILKKKGVPVKGYGAYIEKVEGGFVLKDHLAATLTLAPSPTTTTTTVTSPVEPTPAPTAKKKKAVKPTAQPVVVTPVEKPVKVAAATVSVASFMRDLILAGHTNEEVWKAAQAAYGLDAKKRGYPAWYRTELRRKGALVDRVAALPTPAAKPSKPSKRVH